MRETKINSIITSNAKQFGVVLLSMIMLVSGCVVFPEIGPDISTLNPSQIQPKEGFGQIIIYRPGRVLESENWGSVPEIRIDGKTLVETERSVQHTLCVFYGAHLINVPTGAYDISLNKWSLNDDYKLTVHVESNRRYYVRCGLKRGKIFGIIFHGDPVLEIIDSDVGEEEVFKSDAMKLVSIQRYELK